MSRFQINKIFSEESRKYHLQSSAGNIQSLNALTTVLFLVKILKTLSRDRCHMSCAFVCLVLFVR